MSGEERFFVWMGALVAIAVCRGLWRIATFKPPAHPTLPPPAQRQIVRHMGGCGCGWVGSLIADPLLPAPVCDNCAMLYWRGAGACPEMQSLPPGMVVGTCRGCGAEGPVARPEGLMWMCARCYSFKRTGPPPIPRE